MDDLVVSVLRGHRVLGYDDPAVGGLELADRLITIVRATPATHVAPDARPLPATEPLRTARSRGGFPWPGRRACSPGRATCGCRAAS